MGSHLIGEFSLHAAPLLGDLTGLLDTLYRIFTVALGLGFVIFIHELGHFLAAKACGVKCEKFYVGFDPPMKFLPSALLKFQWGETEYGIGIIPLGGYVKMLGQDDNPNRAAEEAERAKVVTTDPDGQERVELDPRSYVAKSVPQRMLIISAGVIMNLISAIFLAAVAYKMGVNITPVEVAGSSPGDPAWVQGLLPGDQVIQVGEQGEPDEHLRWRWEFTQEVIKAGISSGKPIKPMDLLVRDDDGQQRWVHLTPSDRQKDIIKVVSVGVHATGCNRLHAVSEHLPAGTCDPPLKAGDRIIAINGQALSTNEANKAGEVPATEINKALVRQVNEPLDLTIERPVKDSEPQTMEVLVEPNPVKSLGIVMKIGPVVGVRAGSTAEEAGLAVGDEIVSIQGQPVGDPLTLPYRLPGDETLEIVVSRGGEKKTFQVPQKLDDWNALYDGRGARLALETIGLAYGVSRIVDHVDPNSPAAKADPPIEPGAEVTVLQVVAEGDLHKKAKKLYGDDYNKPQELDDEVFTWAFVNGYLQAALPGIEVRLTVVGDGSTDEIRVAPYSLTGVNYPERGMILAPMQRIHKAETWGQAFKLGARETGEKVKEVWNVLTMLVTGQLALKNLGGPVLIARVAGSEAGEGIPRLLLFLTFLSANLAILNFLPIPVLDGGHMVFLMAEGVLGRPVPERIQMTLTFVGFCCLMALMVFVFTNDIARLFGS